MATEAYEVRKRIFANCEDSPLTFRFRCRRCSHMHEPTFIEDATQEESYTFVCEQCRTPWTGKRYNLVYRILAVKTRYAPVAHPEQARYNQLRNYLKYHKDKLNV